MPEPVTTLAFVLHVGGGIIGLLSGVVATAARKGGRLHRSAGNIFFVSMLIMAAFAVYLGFVVPRALVNVVIGVFVAYLVATSWITARRADGSNGLPERFSLAIGLLLWVPFMLLSFHIAPAFVHDAFSFKGPIMVAIQVFTVLLTLAVAGDIRLLVSGGISGIARISRHLWRMCIALTLATGSALSNGLPRLMPAGYELPDWTLALQLIWVVLLIYWLVRVRFPGWSHGRAKAL